MKQGKRKQVRKFGEVFSPDPLVSLALNQLPVKIWGDVSAILLEPTCGDGAIVIQLLQKRTQALGGTEEAVLTALETIFAGEIQKKNITTCRKRLLTFVQSITQNPKAIKRAKIIISRNIGCQNRLSQKEIVG
jgi:hypothetical protein